MTPLLLSTLASKNRFCATEIRVKCSFWQIVSVHLSNGDPNCGPKKYLSLKELFIHSVSWCIGYLLLCNKLSQTERLVTTLIISASVGLVSCSQGVGWSTSTSKCSPNSWAKCPMQPELYTLCHQSKGFNGDTAAMENRFLKKLKLKRKNRVII